MIRVKSGPGRIYLLCLSVSVSLSPSRVPFYKACDSCMDLKSGAPLVDWLNSLHSSKTAGRRVDQFSSSFFLHFFLVVYGRKQEEDGASGRGTAAAKGKSMVLAGTIHSCVRTRRRLFCLALPLEWFEEAINYSKAWRGVALCCVWARAVNADGALSDSVNPLRCFPSETRRSATQNSYRRRCARPELVGDCFDCAKAAAGFRFYVGTFAHSHHLPMVTGL